MSVDSVAPGFARKVAKSAQGYYLMMPGDSTGSLLQMLHKLHAGSLPSLLEKYKIDLETRLNIQILSLLQEASKLLFKHKMKNEFIQKMPQRKYKW